MMRSRPIYVALLFLLPVLSIAQEVIMSGEALYNTNFSIINSMIGSTGGKAKAGKKAPSKAKLSDLSFVRSETLSRSIEADFISKLAKEQPASKPALQAAFANHTLRNQFDQLLAGYGYSSLNLADVMTAYLVINWQVIHGTDFNDKRGFDAVRDMMRGVLLQTDFVFNASTTDKQTMAETYGYQSMVSMATYKVLNNQKKERALAELQQAVYKQTLVQTGIDLKKVTLGSKGFTSV